MEQPSQTEVDRAEVDDVRLQAISERLARNTDGERFKALNITPERRKDIEDRLRKGQGIVSIAREVGSSPATVAVVRDRLVESEPELFKRQMLGTLHRIANKTAATIEKGLEQLEQQQIKPGQIPGLSVALGILLDKTQVLAGEPAVSVVEHRVKVDAETLKTMLAQNEHQRLARDCINVTAT